MKQKIIPIASVLIGILAFFLTGHYLRVKHKEIEDIKKEIYKGARKIAVVAAAEDIPDGAIIAENDLGRKHSYEIEVSMRQHVVTVADAKLILGRKTTRKINRGEAIFWSDIEGGAEFSTGLASIVKPRMRAISLSIGGAAGVSGMVRPNDRVDVLGTFSFPSKKVPDEMETVTLTVLQDVTVLATGQTLAKQQMERGSARGAGGYSTVTLEVTPREAELLVFAQQMKGSLALSLRNPGDVSFETDLPEINFEHIESKLPELNLYRQQKIRHRNF